MRRLLPGVLLLTVACGAPTTDRAADSGALPRDVSTPAANGPTGASWPGFIGEFLAVENAHKGEALLFRRDATSVPVHISVVGYDSGPARPLSCVTCEIFPVPPARSFACTVHRVDGEWRSTRRMHTRR